MKRIAWMSPLIVAMTVVVALLWWWTPPAGLEAWASGPPPAGTWPTWERQVAAWRDAGDQRQIRYEYRPLEAIPIDLQIAVLVGEDINFFGHGGIDFTAVREALDEWWAGERLRGASTISQQLAKNLYLSNARSWLRKLREAKIAWWLERELGKRRILELYLNVIEFDEGVLGVEAAARHHYGKISARLTPTEAAGVAAAIPAPHTSNPSTMAQSWQNRRAVIEARMGQANWLRRLLRSLNE